MKKTEAKFNKESSRLFYMETYSHSKLNTFEKCPLKYKYRYIDRIISLRETIEVVLGKAVHETLEWLYKEIKKNKIPKIDEVMIGYSKNWGRNYHPEILIVRDGLTAEDYFNKGIQFLLSYYTEHHPFDDNTLELEKEIKVIIDENGEYQIKGFIDRLSYNLKTGEYEIHDYKTSNSLPNKDRIDDDKQLALYSIAIKEEFGKEKNICLIWHYLNFNKKICIRKTTEQLEKLKKETLELIKKIESTAEFYPRKSALCEWCEYKTMCSEWN